MADVLRGIGCGMNFMKVIISLSKIILFICGIASMIFFWIIIGIYYEQRYLYLSILMLKIIRMGILLLCGSGFFYFMLDLFYEFLLKRRFKAHKKEIEEEELKKKLKLDKRSKGKKRFLKDENKKSSR
ncbi:unnamed protein product [marine sediment metagenome]|uniref:Uncharacterized protein n=1 Tax=marine sediment metagenome TaxID=412755 RepID=X0SPS1_9ZZZZ